MTNKSILLNRLYPELPQWGIPVFGYYANKTSADGLEKHNHGSNYEICFLEDGQQPYFIYPDKAAEEENTTLYHLYGGEVFITRPHEMHSTGTSRQMRGRLYWIQLDSECPCLLMQTPQCSALLQKALAGLDTPILRIPQSISSKLIQAFHLMLVKDDEKFLQACALLTLFILELADFNSKIQDHSRLGESLSGKVLGAVDFIRNNLLSPTLNLDSIAEHMHYSSSYAMYIFRKEIGLTIHEFILQSKIDYACELLLTHSVTETALLLHFSSSQHFSKVFKEHTGRTPSDYVRERIKK